MLNKTAKLSLALTLACTMMACSSGGTSTATTTAPTTESGKTAMTPGVYTYTTVAMDGDLEVQVEVSEDAILSVEVTKEDETVGIGSPLRDPDGNLVENGGKTPVELLPEQIVTYQTLNVDNVSGATITSYAIKTAVRGAMEEAGANISEWQDELPKAEAPADQTADVVIIGAGGAGLAAAAAAAQNGASVVIIDASGSVGGNTLVASGGIGAVNPEKQHELPMASNSVQLIEAALNEEPVSEEHKAIQDTVRQEWNEYLASGETYLFDSTSWHALQTWNGGDKLAKLELVQIMADNVLPTMEWLETMGMEFGAVSEGGGSLWPRVNAAKMHLGSGYISVLLNELANYDVTIITEAKGKELIVEDGRVVGVECETTKGDAFTLTANNGVIVATGGFGGNLAMVEEYNTTGKWPDLSNATSTNRPSQRGEGITLATEVGANTLDMEQIQLLYQGNVKTGLMKFYWARPFYHYDQIIWVNKYGERFVREDERRDVLCQAILEQDDQMFYYIESADGVGFEDPRDPDWRSPEGLTWEYLESNGYGFIADTLPELAEKLGMDPEVLVKTVDDFNAAVEAGVDDLGRTLYSVKLENGPWMAMPRKASVHFTMGGVEIDGETHVLDGDGNIIEGLYAAGEVVGGIHGANRIAANAFSDIFTFGKIAGETVVSDNN